MKARPRHDVLGHDQGKAESLEPCLKAMDLLNSALGLHEDMRNGSKPVPLKGGSVSGRDGRTGDDSTDPPRAGGEQKKSEVLRDFLAPSEGEPPSTGAEGSLSGVRDSKAGPGLGPSTCSSAASLRLYQLPAVREACGGFDPKRCIGEGGFGKVRMWSRYHNTCGCRMSRAGRVDLATNGIQIQCC